MECPEFWCIFNDCCSFNSGDLCPFCSRFSQCDSCILQDTSPNIDACRRSAYEICYGVFEEEDF